MEDCHCRPRLAPPTEHTDMQYAQTRDEFSARLERILHTRLLCTVELSRHQRPQNTGYTA